MQTITGHAKFISVIPELLADWALTKLYNLWYDRRYCYNIYLHKEVFRQECEVEKHILLNLYL